MAILVKMFMISDNFNPDESINVGMGTVTKEECEHLHEFIEIVYIMDGEAQHKVGEYVYKVKKGDMLFINLNQVHSFVPKDSMQYVNILVKPSVISHELINNDNALDILTLTAFEEFSGRIEKITPFISFCGSEIIKVKGIVEDMLYEYNHKEVGYRSLLQGYLRVLLVQIFRRMHANEVDDSVSKHIQIITPEILQYIEDNCFEKISLSELARRSFYNPSYFSRAFKECFGVTLTAYIQNKRFEGALKLLKETDMSIEEIYNVAGYCDKKQFYKIFKHYTGTSPGKFRKEMNSDSNNDNG